ncbi:MAG TPA: GPP34 family phosphoprotein [Streptosporangiaceae bacterium]|jgi:thioredoxin-like negative regulator of GroEL|nr:GPP34 family phosphoprotein [Streptosporangiaceae bacterium]
MSSLTEDLLLAAIDPGNGVMRCRGHLQYGLMGAELVELAGAGRIGRAADPIEVVQPVDLATGDGDLDAVLGALARARRSVKVRRWVSRPRRKIVDGYLDRLIAAGAVRRAGGVLRPRWPVTDQGRGAAVRARLDAAVLGAGPIDAAQADLPCLAAAIGLVDQLYRGRDNRAARQRLLEITKTHWVAEPVRRAIAAAEAASSAG